METTAEELNQKKLVILIPFQLLKLRKLLEENRCPENLNALQNLIQNDIIGSIETNLKLGNISMDDGRRLRNLTKKLYDHIYAHYDEMEVLNKMTDESLLLEYDIIEMEHEKALAEKDKVIQEKDNALHEKDNALQSALQEKEHTLKKLDSIQQENARLKAELAKLLQR